MKIVYLIFKVCICFFANGIRKLVHRPLLPPNAGALDTLRVYPSRRDIHDIGIETIWGCLARQRRQPAESCSYGRRNRNIHMVPSWILPSRTSVLQALGHATANALECQSRYQTLLKSQRQEEHACTVTNRWLSCVPGASANGSNTHNAPVSI